MFFNFIGDPLYLNSQPAPVVKAVIPTEGSVGQNVTVVGDNFFVGMQIFFGNTATYCEVLTPHAAKVLAPARTSPGVVDISIGLKGRPCSKGPMGRFMYVHEPGTFI